MSNGRHAIKLVTGMTLIYAFSYLAVGALAYALITNQFYVGDNAVFTLYLRSESSPEQWSHVMAWQFPILFLRSLLIALVILPFVSTLRKMPFWKSSILIFAFLFVLTHLAAAAPSPGNLEGIIYMKPELLSAHIFLLIQPEMLVQTLLVAGGFTYIIKRVQ